MRVFTGLVATAALASFSSPAMAQMIEADYQTIASAMQDAGYRATIEGEGSDRYVSSASGGFNFGIFFYGCNDAGDNCKTIQFYAGFSPEKSPTLRQMNDYAKQNRWGRVYLDDDNEPAIEMDLDLEDGGMPKALFIDNIEYWEAVMQQFGSWVFENSDAK